MKLPILNDDIRAVFDFLIYAFVFGILINYSVWIIFKFPITFYSFPAWGIALWFIENKFVKYLRGIWVK
jgi:hypothetical protein